jgi:SAM-dependent methyltransferase
MFTCNLCGGRNNGPARPLEREEASCERCGSSVRTRALLRALSIELFGMPLVLGDFPRVKSLRGLGTSDPRQYADKLGEKFDYQNTFYHREPRFDLTTPPEHELGRYDFIVSSEVLEHVLPPVERAFASAWRLLKPAGVLVTTVPYSIEASMAEHYPEAHEFGFVRLGERVALVNRTRSGEVQVFDNPVFHVSWGGAALEMREFSETDLRRMIEAGGFTEIRTYAEDDPQFGIWHAEKWSLPMAARKGVFAFSLEATRDLVEHWREVRQDTDRAIRRYERSYWVRLGRKLGLV